MYIPVIKNRTIEMGVLKEFLELELCDKVIPMVEIIQEKTRSNSKNNYIDDLKSLFLENERKFLLNFPQITPKRSNADPVKEFLTGIGRDNDLIFKNFVTCEEMRGMIPVISFNEKMLLGINDIKVCISKLPKTISCKGLKLTNQQYQVVAKDIDQLLSKGDYLILDIDNRGYSNPIFKKTYKSINDSRKKIGFISVILNSNRPVDFYNKDIIDGEPIEEIDNSLLSAYNMKGYNFDAYSDYAGVTSSLPGSGGAISPAGIYYSFENNFFVGYRGNGKVLSEFKEHIAPSIFRSEYWSEFSDEHHDRCPGCKMINAIVNKDKSGMSQGQWKGITMSHYIYSVAEDICK
ncbi:MAG: hypothetical protein C0603_08545 [Denitrovibrio sp.]|nr:MAG: hypothetical protein C0603_08545 [Denitrovibrio sp.]